MEGHLIRLVEVPHQGSCNVLCYMEPNCVSINLGPSQGGNYICKLNVAVKTLGIFCSVLLANTLDDSYRSVVLDILGGGGERGWGWVVRLCKLRSKHLKHSVFVC